MRVSAKADYAVRAAAELAAAEEGPVKGERLAEAQDIPLQFLEHILLELKHAGIVRARRGAKGGYWLARPADEVTVADIVRAVEGPIAHVQSTPPEYDRVPRQRRAPAGGLDRRPRQPPHRPRAGHPRRPRLRRAAGDGQGAGRRPRRLGRPLAAHSAAGTPPATTLTKFSRWRVVQHSKAPSQ